jgi:hypothetical protein
VTNKICIKDIDMPGQCGKRNRERPQHQKRKYQAETLAEILANPEKYQFFLPAPALHPCLTIMVDFNRHEDALTALQANIQPPVCTLSLGSFPLRAVLEGERPSVARRLFSFGLFSLFVSLLFWKKKK